MKWIGIEICKVNLKPPRQKQKEVRDQNTVIGNGLASPIITVEIFHKNQLKMNKLILDYTRHRMVFGFTLKSLLSFFKERFSIEEFENHFD
jgi:hypothetical protein